MEKNYPVDEYEDIENYGSGSGGGGIKEICLRLFSKACSEGSREWTESGIITRFMNGQSVEVMLPDQREIFINSVQMLHTAVLPKEMRCKDDDINKMFKDVKDAISKLNKWRDDGLAELRSQFSQGKMQHLKVDMKNQKVSEYNHTMKEIETTYNHKLTHIHKDLLNAISCLMDKLNYFEEVGGYF